MFRIRCLLLSALTITAISRVDPAHALANEQAIRLIRAVKRPNRPALPAELQDIPLLVAAHHAGATLATALIGSGAPRRPTWDGRHRNRRGLLGSLLGIAEAQSASFGSRQPQVDAYCRALRAWVTDNDLFILRQIFEARVIDNVDTALRQIREWPQDLTEIQAQRLAALEAETKASIRSLIRDGGQTHKEGTSAIHLLRSAETSYQGLLPLVTALRQAGVDETVLSEWLAPVLREGRLSANFAHDLFSDDFFIGSTLEFEPHQAPDLATAAGHLTEQMDALAKSVGITPDQLTFPSFED